MKKRVIVVPGDCFISVEGRGLNFDFTPLTDFTVIQWYGEQGEIEHHDAITGNRNEALKTAVDYDTYVAPYVALWEEEKARLDAKANRPLTDEEQTERRRTEIMGKLTEIDAASVRPLRAIAQGEATQEDREKLAYLDAEAEALRLELAGLV
jgi:hypothetical protein